MFNCSNYGNDLNITKKDAATGSHSGDCESDIIFLMCKPYIKKQLAKLDAVKLSKELKEYGAWDEIELTDHQENLKRWLWLSCGDIAEGR